MRTMRFWNTLYQVRSKPKEWKPKMFNVFRNNTTKVHKQDTCLPLKNWVLTTYQFSLVLLVCLSQFPTSKKSLKILNRYSEAVLRRTDNTNIGQSYVDFLTLPLHNLIFTIKIENL